MVQPEESEGKRVQLDPDNDPSKYVVIGKELDPK
jgi:hypothetical protein